MLSLRAKVCGVVLALALVWVYPASANAPTFHKQIKPKQVIPLAMSHPKQYAQFVTKLKGWGAREFQCLDNIWTRESHWNYKAFNSTVVWQNGKRLHAFGIWQGITETSKDPATQIRNGIRYVEHRYGSACRAWSWWQVHYSY